MTFRPPLLVVGILGFLVFVGTGVTATIPWQASGLFAVPFLAPAIGEIREYFEREKAKPSKPAKPSALPAPKTEKKPEPEPKPKPMPMLSPESNTVSKGNPIQEAVVIRPKSIKRYKVTLAEGDTLTAHAGADDWIRIELLNLTESQKKDSGKSRYDWENRKDGKNATVVYDAKRNGNWFVYVTNLSNQQEVGVTLEVE